MKAGNTYNLLLELVRIPSVSPSKEESRLARVIHDKLASLPYFQENKGDLRLLPVENDPYGRHSVFAIVRAVPHTAKTVILMGHIDVVDTAEARELAQLAFDPPAYARELSKLTLPDEARKDLESGNYLFGRGVFDMKCGVAVELEYVRECAANPRDLDTNIALILVGDEENRSAGMLSSIKHLERLQEEEGLDFVACVNTEGEVQEYDGDAKRYISVGTIGKLMPMFYCVGRESHVGSYYEGLNANLLASAVNMVLEGSPDWIDRAGAEAYPPPAALWHRDLREVYSVTLPAQVVAGFNVLTVEKTPAIALEMMKKVAREAFDMALERLRNSALKFSEGASLKASVPWEPKVLTYEEVFQKVKQDMARSGASLEGHIKEYLKGLPRETDDRLKSIGVVGQVLKFYADKDPVIIVGFLPPYYPHRSNLRKAPRELALMDAVQGLISEAASTYGETLAVREHFAAISDLSYLGFQGDKDDLMPLAGNTPGWGEVYDLPLDSLLKLDVPVVNIGASGRDAHKYTERLDLEYYLGPYPDLFRSLLRRISKIE
ncbi:MAG TPA: M20/M25/M40 family metallo-hydrolase [Firmicutes bacterium]|nr:M20/M25/M40 family metallo-hydrolase [Candidatus Fermentithermobacillaceae bacterium]